MLLVINSLGVDTQMHTCMQMHAHTHAHACTHTHAHACTTHTRMHTDTHTHRHTNLLDKPIFRNQVCVCPCLRPGHACFKI